MENLTCAIEFNNKAAAFLQGGSAADALHMLQGALQIMSQLDRHGKIQESNPCIKLASAKILRETEATVTEKMADFNTSFIYRRPMEWRSKISNDGLYHKNLLLAIMFNKSLAIHLYALEQNSYKVEESLQMAALSYEITYDLLFDDEVSQKRLPIPPRRFFMALLNNMGQIYHELGQYDKSQSFLDELSKQLHSDKTTTDVESCFYVNTIVLIPPSAASAA